MPKNSEVLMNEEKRSNEGYEIIESRTIGNTEFVVGHNPKAPDPYVCWVCRNGNDYYWGRYRGSLEAARFELRNRCEDEVRYLRDTHQLPPKSRKDHER